MYIHHAKNLVEGILYEQVGFIPNPDRIISPRTEPPVFPFLLAGVYKIWGLHIPAMKLLNIIIFLGSLAILYRIFRSSLNSWLAWLGIALVGFHPWFWGFKDNVLSDIPFLFFTMAALLFISRARKDSVQVPASLRYQLVMSLWAGILISLSVGTRNIGLIIIPCLVCYELLRFKKITVFLVVTPLVVAALVWLQTLFHSPQSHVAVFTLNLDAIRFNLTLYGKIMLHLWGNSYIPKLAFGVFYLSFIFALIGFSVRVRKSCSVFELFFILYCIPLIIWPHFDGPRFLFPLIPLFVFYCFIGVSVLLKIRRWFIGPILAGLVLLSLCGSVAAAYTTLSFDSRIDEGIAKKETQELFKFIREHTEKDAVFLFAKPRVLALFTGRSASVAHRTRDPKELGSYCKKINAQYIIAARVFPSDIVAIYPFLKRYPFLIGLVFENADFRVYRLRGLTLF